jgi:glycosyltransferase involved in cell wall biosynthesis
MTKMFFDIHLSGHHSEYINHLVDYLIDQKDNDTYVFVVNPMFYKRFSFIVDKTKNTEHISWMYLTEDEFNEVANTSMLKGSFKNLDLVIKYQSLINAETVFLLNFNIYQLALAIKKLNFLVRGILFKPFYRMEKKTLADKAKFTSRLLLTKLYGNNKKIENVYILNDDQAVTFYNRQTKSQIFRMLPDPIPNLKGEMDFDLRAFYDIEKNQKVLLHIGSLGNRKGTIEIIQSVDHIPEGNKNDYVILLVGKADSEISEKTMNSLIKQSKHTNKTKIIWNNNFVSNANMKSHFEQCDVVLMPYKNAESSSGILGHAMASNKPVITTGKGLLKDLVNQTGCGLTIADVTALHLANQYKNIDQIEFNKDKIEAFVQAHSVLAFSKCLLH